MSDHFGKAIPIFRVANVRDSVDYYVNKLGFKFDWGFEGNFASVSREKSTIFLSAGDQGHTGAWTWIGVDDVDALHEDFRRRGAKVRQPPTNFKWACEIQIEDLDGNVLRLGSDTKPNVPFGPWMDMNGKLWEVKAEG